MKKNLLLLCSFLVAAALVGCSETATEEETQALSLTVSEPGYYTRFKDDNISINVYNWGEYIADGSEEGILDVNAEFTKLTGIKVNYSTYATNEELYAKLKGGGSSYDIIIPSDYMISRMISEDMLLPLDMDNIPNFKNITSTFVNPEYDPENKFSVPYTWGTVGIIYDNTAISDDSFGWEILWDEQYKDQILMFDNPRDAFAVAELYLGYSLNTENSEELGKAAELLKKQKTLVQAYVMDEIFDKMGAGEAVLAPYYAGDALTLMDEYEHLSFVIPEEGTNLFVDAMCIPAGARNKEAAEMYINFMCEPDVAYSTTSYIGYSTPNDGALAMVDEEVKNDGISYLSKDYLDSKTEVYTNLSDEANRLMQDKWTDMKSSEENNQNPWIVPLFMIACILLSVGILIYRHVKAKKDIF
ncbi:MAG: spermidine/putrescine ABC transporter substrate-binding protein [Clostridia bacterium]|nr:spermidine/putrescine ABC transporter substrate-binding protein [Clostridia bacterium]